MLRIFIYRKIQRLRPGLNPRTRNKRPAIAKKVCTACSRTRYKIVPLTNFNKYLHNGIGETEIDTNLSVNNGSEKDPKKRCDFLLHLITVVTYGEINKTYYFFKIKNYPKGKLKPLNTKTLYLMYVFCN
jgi:hypothetical protein